MTLEGRRVPARWPRLRRGELTQMRVEALDKPDNPAMSDWSVTSKDVSGGIVLVDFQLLLFKVALTRDFVT